MIVLKNKEKAIKIIEQLKQMYPNATCSLAFKTPFELGVAVMLSAQCTDARVNLITPSLFAECDTPEALVKIDIERLEELIHPCGFYKNKAKNLKGYAEKIIKDYGGRLPETIDELIKLPGIGRKSANVIMLEAFNKPCGIAIDTHAKRISNKLGLSKQKDPSKIEQDLLNIIPNEYLKDVNHLFVWHGRNLCTARNPKCIKCHLKKYCDFNSKEE